MQKISKLVMFLFFVFSIAFAIPACGDSSNSLYTVSFETNGGSAVDAKTVKTIDVSPTTIKDDYNFLGWYLDKGFYNEATFPLSVDKDLKLYAKWRKTKEKYNAEFLEYLRGQDGGSIISTATSSSKNGDSSATLQVGCVGSSVIYSYDKEESSYSGVYSKTQFMYDYDWDLSFQYGEYSTATGYLIYTYKYYFNNGLVSSLTATFKITSLKKSGNTYLLEGYFVSFTPKGSYSKTDEQVLNDFQTDFSFVTSTFKSNIPHTYRDTILEY